MASIRQASPGADKQNGAPEKHSTRSEGRSAWASTHKRAALPPTTSTRCTRGTSASHHATVRRLRCRAPPP
eukprot:1383213-Pleurochrysis_carterae.AAC.1